MAFEPTKVSINNRMSDLIRNLSDADFDLMLNLIDQLPDDLEDFGHQYKNALSAIARIHPYAFVCVRKSPTSNHWFIVEIYEDRDPDGLPPGGGRHAGYAGDMFSIFPQLPETLRQLFANAKDLVELPVITNSGNQVTILPEQSYRNEIQFQRNTYGLNSSITDYLNHSTDQFGMEEFSSAWTFTYDLLPGIAADITPKASLMPSTTKVMFFGTDDHDHR